MIRKLSLKKFGKFRGQDFVFAPVTLFCGENEAGKTTVFDALLDGLCNPRGTTLSGKRLTARYGVKEKERIVFLDFEADPVSLDEADFLNLFAVRSGMINLEIDKNSEWMNNVKASLFSGGINPQAAAAALDKHLSERKKGSLGNEAGRLAAEIEKLNEELAGVREEREKCLALEKQVEDMNRGVQQTEKETAALKAEIAALEQSLEQQNFLREKKTAEDALADITGSLRKNRDLEKYSRCNPAELEKLVKQDKDLGRLKAETEAAACAENETVKNRQRLIQEKNRRAADRDRAERQRSLAAGLKENIVPREKLITRKTYTAWRKAPLAAAVIVFLAGAAGYLAGPSAYRLWFFGAGAVAASFLAAVSASRRIREDTSALDAALNFVRQSWKNQTGEDMGVSYDEVLAVLNSAADKAAFAEDNFQNIVRQEALNEEEAAACAARGKQAELAYRAARRDLLEALETAGVTSTEDYASRLGTKEALLAQCSELEEKLETWRAAHNASSVTALEDMLRRKVDELNRKITGQELPPAEIRRKENILKEKKARLEQAQAREKENRENYGRGEGTVRGQFRGIPEKMAACEKGVAEKKRRLGEIEKEIEAIKIAREIFISLSADSDGMLGELSREIGETFSAFTGAQRTVSLCGYTADGARVSDADGAARETGRLSPDPQKDSGVLSAGTRDAFLLAARLVLARKSAAPERRAVIVLDEPFITLDRRRTDRALAVLEEFRKTTGWQLVLLTKDETLEASARKVFGASLAVHKLNCGA
ncbi:MAG: AAA family ATPase [Spirochaetales bacterium]|jgi:DNA repair exonuclease SbcCD ATPase subunit|nr:AAA family ATPase [Spirochaetales bacterium]